MTIQGVSNRIQIIIKEIRVHVESHGRRSVSQHPLDRFHVRSSGHRQRRRGVSQVADRYPRECRIVFYTPSHCSIKHPAPEVTGSDHPAISAPEQCRRGLRLGCSLSKLGDQKRRERHRAALMIFGSPPYERASNFGHGNGVVQPAPLQINSI